MFSLATHFRAPQNNSDFWFTSAKPKRCRGETALNRLNLFDLVFGFYTQRQKRFSDVPSSQFLHLKTCTTPQKCWSSQVRALEANHFDAVYWVFPLLASDHLSRNLSGEVGRSEWNKIDEERENINQFHIAFILEKQNQSLRIAVPNKFFGFYSPPREKVVKRDEETNNERRNLVEEKINLHKNQQNWNKSQSRRQHSNLPLWACLPRRWKKLAQQEVDAKRSTRTSRAEARWHGSRFSERLLSMPGEYMHTGWKEWRSNNSIEAEIVITLKSSRLTFSSSPSSCVPLQSQLSASFDGISGVLLCVFASPKSHSTRREQQMRHILWANLKSGFGSRIRFPF